MPAALASQINIRMWGCCRLAAIVPSRRNRSGAQRGREVWPKHLHGHFGPTRGRWPEPWIFCDDFDQPSPVGYLPTLASSMNVRFL